MPGHRTAVSHIPLLSCSVLPFPPLRANTSIPFYLQLWSSWPWESRWSWPSSPVLKSWGAGQRNTGIFSSSRKSPLCICVAPQSWAWCSCGVSTVPEASERKQVQRTTHIKTSERGGEKSREDQLMKGYGWLLAVHPHFLTTLSLFPLDKIGSPGSPFIVDSFEENHLL